MVGEVITQKVVLIGIDGASWNIINLLMSRGKLPNFSFLVKNGTSGTLESIDPSFTPIVWTSIATGKRPEVHGIRHIFQTRYDIKTLTIWDIIEDYQKTIGIFNWHVTSPARQVNGFMFPGGFALKSEETFPCELSFLLRIRKMIESQGIGGSFWARNLTTALKAMKNGLTVDSLCQIANHVIKYMGINDRGVSEASRSLLAQYVFADIYLKLYKRFNPFFSAFYLGAIDVAAHTTWKYYDPERFKEPISNKSRKFGQLIPASYMSMDKCIGRILNAIDKKTAVIVVSDHGTKPATNGEATFDIDGDSLFEKLGIRQKVDFFSLDHKTYFSIREKYLGEKEDIIEQLSHITIGENGQKLFKISESDVHNIYSIRCEPFDLGRGKSQEKFAMVKKRFVRLHEIVNINNFRVSGIHDRYGIFIAYGPNIKQGNGIDEIGILDIVPTILYYVGLPLATDMEGQVKYSMFGNRLKENNQAKYIDTYDTDERLNKYLLHPSRNMKEIICEHGDREEVKKRLRALGYL